MMEFDFQYHTHPETGLTVLVDVRQIEDEIPHGKRGIPKPWGKKETSGAFSIQRKRMTAKEGELHRLTALAHKDEPEEGREVTEDSLVEMILERRDDDGFRSRLSALGIQL